MFSQPSEQETVDRLSLLLVLENYGHPLPKTDLTRFIIENEILKYFDMHQLLDNLVENQLIESVQAEDETAFQLTENGRVSLAFFRSRMPMDLQNTLTDLVSTLPAPERSSTAVVASHRQQADGNFEVTLELYEDRRRLMGLSLEVISVQQARLIEERWEKDADYLYGDILNLLIKEPPNRG